MTDALDDHRLVADVARTVGVPRAKVADDQVSFALHAPLELMARAALLPYVAPDARHQARRRVVELGTRYEASGPPVNEPASVEFATVAEGVERLAAAIDAEDLDAVDVAAAWVGAHSRPDELTGPLADVALDRLSAAGHGNIYLQLLDRNQPRGLPGQMLRHPARELADASHRRIRIPPARTASGRTDSLLTALTHVRVVDPPPSPFIAPMVEHAQARGAFEVLLDDDGGFTAPTDSPFALLRFAAQAMLQGPEEQAPFGWTHCLTLAQAPLLVAGRCDDRARAVFVACAYLAAHWACHGDGSVDLDFVPAPISGDVRAALDAHPGDAAAVAWHSNDPQDTIAALATSAATAEDAHRVKYTLACLDAATADPSHQQLFLAAAAYLNAWWNVQLRS